MKIFSMGLFVCMFLIAPIYSISQPENPDVRLKVVIIRHGEKPSNGDNLCPRGLERAGRLPAVLDRMVGVPDYTYIPKINTGKSTRSVRMLQTITPFAVEHNLTLNSDFKNEDVSKMADDVLKKKGVVLIVWEHSSIPDLVKALKVDGKRKWKDEDYDSMWIIEFRKNEKKPEFQVEQQNLELKAACD